MIPHTDLSTGFETKVCSRCGGSGKYSYCQSYGSTCFKCSGKGAVYTVRGLAAIAYARSLREVEVRTVEVGWLMWVASSPLGGKSGWLKVTEAMHQSGSRWGKDGEWMPYWDISHSGGGQGFCYPTDTVQAVASKSRLAEVRALALVYQQGLTQAGKVRKGGR
jgi:hypothetical protein